MCGTGQEPTSEAALVALFGDAFSFELRTMRAPCAGCSCPGFLAVGVRSCGRRIYQYLPAYVRRDHVPLC